MNYPVNFGLALIQGGGPMAQDGSNGFIIWIVGVIVGIIFGVLISLALRKSKSKAERLEPAQTPSQINTPPAPAPAKRIATHARRCPVCNSTYTDEALIYCVSDGASLVPVINRSSEQDPGATLLYRETGNRDVPPTVPSRPDENQR